MEESCGSSGRLPERAEALGRILEPTGASRQRLNVSWRSLVAPVVASVAQMHQESALSPEETPKTRQEAPTRPQAGARESRGRPLDGPG